MSLTNNDENVFQALMGVCNRTSNLDSNGFNDPASSSGDNFHIVVTGVENILDADLIQTEKKAIELVEDSKNTRYAINLLENIILQDPTHASAYNNLAQAYRILIQEEVMDKKERDDVYIKIIQALETCIKICQPESMDKKKKIIYVSDKRHISLLKSCHTQMSLVYMEMAKLARNSNDNEDQADEIWNLEAQASKHLELAGVYGNEIAKKLSVFKNPYAQLCGNIVRKSLANEFSAYGGDNDEASAAEKAANTP